jgi:membrane-associated phospholipid phosphatase
MSVRRRITLAARAAGGGRQVGRRQAASAAAAASSVVLVRSRKKLGLPKVISSACAFAAIPAVAWGFRRSRLRDAVVWAAQMWAYKNAFEIPNDDEKRHRGRAHTEYPIVIDERLGSGVAPSQRLQRTLRHRGQLSWLDKAMSFFYWTWEAEPHLVMMWIRWRRPDRFAAAAGRLAATFDLTLLGYWIAPTAPPWWSSEKLGRMDGDVRRVMVEVSDWLKRDPNPTEGDHELGANPFAAMPSDHFASAAMTAMLLGEESALLGALGWSYALALAFALVYLGEHYLIDELVGLALVLAVSCAGRPLERLADAVLALGPGR